MVNWWFGVFLILCVLTKNLEINITRESRCAPLPEHEHSSHLGPRIGQLVCILCFLFRQILLNKIVKIIFQMMIFSFYVLINIYIYIANRYVVLLKSLTVTRQSVVIMRAFMVSYLKIKDTIFFSPLFLDTNQNVHVSKYIKFFLSPK